MKKIFKFCNLCDVKCLAVSAILAAMSILLGKFLAISVGDTIRISLENMPIIISGVCFGPAVGAATGLVADIIGCLLRGYAINPVLTLASVMMGLLSGLLFKAFSRYKRNHKIGLTVAVSHIICSVLIKSAGLYWWYGTSLGFLLVSRSVNYLLVIAAEILLLAVILRRRPISAMIGR